MACIQVERTHIRGPEPRRKSTRARSSLDEMTATLYPPGLENADCPGQVPTEYQDRSLLRTPLNAVSLDDFGTQSCSLIG